MERWPTKWFPVRPGSPAVRLCMGVKPRPASTVCEPSIATPTLSVRRIAQVAGQLWAAAQRIQQQASPFPLTLPPAACSCGQVCAIQNCHSNARRLPEVLRASPTVLVDGPNVDDGPLSSSPACRLLELKKATTLKRVVVMGSPVAPTAVGRPRGRHGGGPCLR